MRTFPGKSFTLLQSVIAILMWHRSKDALDALRYSHYIEMLSVIKDNAMKFCCRWYVHGKNDFAEVSKNLARYSSENNFVGYQNNYKKHKHDEQYCKKFC